MRYILLTKKTNLNFPNVQIISPLQSLYLYGAIDSFKEVDSIAVDIETTGLNPWTDEILLIAFYNPKYDWCLVVDTTTVDIMLFEQLLESKLILAHNIQFEASFLGVKGIEINRCYDTMIAEAKLTQGSGYSTSLINTLTRRHIELPFGMDKDVIQDFISGDFQLQEKHVIYNASDVLALYTLKEIQEDNIKTFKLNYFINSIHNPLALVLNKIKLEGFVFNSKKWIENADNIEEVCNQLVSYLNYKVMPLVDWMKINSDVAKEQEKKEKGIARTEARIIKLKANLFLMKANNKMHLKSFVKGLKSLEKAEEDLVNYHMITFDNYVGINWSSSKQVLSVFEELSLNPLPQAKSSTTHKLQPSISHSARESWLLENPDHKWFELMDIFHSLKNKAHVVNSFGRKWVTKYLNPITEKVHTSYRDNLATGRLSSGNADEGLFNSQQIPKKNEFRTSFIADKGYKIATIDYSSIEMVVVCALADDEVLLELSKGDIHSHFANLGWSAIYKSRGLEWTDADIISKDQNEEKRTNYKSMLFGALYGLTAPKAAETLNVTVAEGQIALNTIKAAIPKSFKLVTDASEFAIVNGYLKANDRTNSRRWFMDVVAANSLDKEIPFMLRRDVESQARNYSIQGTAADIMLESLVTIDRWINLYKLDVKLKLTVHDEGVWQFKVEDTWIPERIGELMNRVANKYFTHSKVKSKVSIEVKDTWIK